MFPVSLLDKQEKQAQLSLAVQFFVLGFVIVASPLSQHAQLA